MTSRNFDRQLRDGEVFKLSIFDFVTSTTIALHSMQLGKSKRLTFGDP